MNIKKKQFVAYSKKYNYLIKYNPKSGCSFFRNLFLNIHKEELTEELANGHHGVWKEFPYNNEQVSHSLHLVRNPYTRVVSMFTNKYIGRLNAQGKVFGNKLFDKIKLEKDDFYHFVLFLQKQKNENKINTIDNHLCEQTLNYDISDSIVKLETVNEDLLDFYKKHYETTLYEKVKYYLEHEKRKMILRTPRNNIQNFVGNEEFKPTQPNIFPKPEYFYNQEIKDIVYNIYKDDFITFNYDKNSI